MTGWEDFQLHCDEFFCCGWQHYIERWGEREGADSGEGGDKDGYGGGGCCYERKREAWKCDRERWGIV